MRIRTILPGFWRSDDVDALTIEDRLLFIGLWSYVDDNGVGIDRVSSIIGDLFAGDMERDPEGTVARVSRGLARLSERKMVSRYEVAGRKYLHITHFSQHQRVDRPSKPRYPLPPLQNTLSEPDSGDPRESSRDTRETLASPPATLAPGEGEKGRSNYKTHKRVHTTPPVENPAPTKTSRAMKTASLLPDDWQPPDEINQALAAKCPQVGLDHELEKFQDYYRTNEKPMKDWGLAWRNWVRKAQEDITAGRRPPTRGFHARPAGTPQPSRNTQIFDSFEQRMMIERNPR